jgi:hypothetical protein
MFWIILGLIVTAATVAGFAVQDRTRGEPPERPLAHRWAALRGR